ncbi:MAG: ribbon-helix-helix protein, CopG family, partial [Desulfovibrionaceae bacterium]|nr:ribbon-helix-helix protein, CopG family [Desulfovibrionaceae bacterium]
RKAARVKIGTTLPPDLLEELKAIVDTRGMTLTAAIEFAVRKYVKEEEEEEEEEVRQTADRG